MRQLFRIAHARGGLPGTPVLAILLGPAILHGLVSAAVAQPAAAGECGSASVALESIDAALAARERGEKVLTGPETIAASIGALSDRPRSCELNALVSLAVSGSAEGRGREVAEASCDAASDPERRTVALQTLEQVAARPIGREGPDAAARRAALDGLLLCIDSNESALERRPARRDLRSAVERAHASLDGSFLPAFRALGDIGCDGIDERLAATNRLIADHPRSAFAVRALYVTVRLNVQAALECGVEGGIERADSAVRTALSDGLTSRSLEGWRLVDDLHYLLAVNAILRGDGEALDRALSALEADLAPSSDEGMYRSTVHPTARALLAAARGTEATGYRDQIYVYLPVLGLTGVEPLERGRRDYFALADVAMALRRSAVVPSVTSTEPGTRQRAEALDRAIRNELTQTDVQVVAGSFATEDRAEARARTLCAALRNIVRNGTCPFEATPIGSNHRVATRPLPKDRAIAIRNAIRANTDIDPFLSRDQVLKPL